MGAPAAEGPLSLSGVRVGEGGRGTDLASQRGSPQGLRSDSGVARAEHPTRPLSAPAPTLSRLGGERGTL